MSEPLQPGYHPDADQICAFVEQALPAHEQEQMLDHLAVCPECRAVVALSLPDVEQAPVASGLKPWWLGWRLAWPASVAIAALVLSVSYIHQTATVRKTSAPAQIAEGRLTAPPAPAAKQPVGSAPIQSAVTNRSTSSFEASVESPSKAETETKSEHKSALGMQSRNSVVLDGLERPAPPPAAFPRQIAGVVEGSGGGMDASVKSAPTAVSGAPLLKTAPAQHEEKPRAASTATSVITLSGRNTQTVAVDSAAPAIQTESVDVSSWTLSENDAQVTQFIQLKHSLPSGLPALSAAMQARRIVAIDLRNGIFLSKDGGKHWKAIHPQWQGRAVRVERVGLAAANSASLNPGREFEPKVLNAVGAAPPPNAAPPLIGATSSLAAAPGASLAGTVADMTGVVIPGTSVSVIESATHATQTVNTDQAGHYSFDGLAPGTYTVEAKARGFVNQSVADVAVAANHQNVANLSLKIGEVTQTVTVSADSMETVNDSAAVESSAKAKKRAAPSVSPTSPPVFAITTENGERWTSADGVTWKRP